MIAHPVMLVVAQPYKERSTAFFATCTSLVLACTLIAALLIKMYDALPVAQVEGFFGFDNVMPLISMILSFNFGVVGLALALVLWLAVHQPPPARRLRFTDSGEEVAAPPLGSWSEQWRSLASHGWNAVCPPARRVPLTAEYHLFLSHHWGTGQDQMRVVKQRLLEVLPGARIFLDVDEPGFEIGDLESYVARSRAVLVFCSRGYFQSKSCMRELRAAVASDKPLIALLEPEAGHGGLAEEEVRRQLLHGHCHDESVRWPWLQHAQPRSVHESYESWGFGPRPARRSSSMRSCLRRRRPVPSRSSGIG